MADINKKRVYLTDKVLELMGDRNRSQVINRNLERIMAASSVVPEPHPSEIQFYHEKIKPKSSPAKYPDQAEIVNMFMEFTGRTFLESIVVLEMIEQSVNK